jgi:glycosyltransferase involved in cell wall biosynthesis
VRLFIPIFDPVVRNKVFSIEHGNPGCGGTEFSSIKLAILFSEAFRDIDVTIVTNQDFMIADQSKFLRIAYWPSFVDFLKKSASELSEGAVVCPISLLTNIDKRIARLFARNIVPWAHHPFDRRLLEFNISFPAIVCSGIYQYFSLCRFYRNLSHIQDIFIPHVFEGGFKSTTIDEKDPLRILYLGALVPAKGFLDIAKVWREIRLVHKAGVEFHVIGSSMTYGIPVEDKVIPTTELFAGAIKKYIPAQDIENGHVIFHGNLGEEKWEIMKRCHVALLNPSGRTEAFPASPLECMACGVPVIASNDYGMSDSMRFFPELSISTASEIPNRLVTLKSNRVQSEALQRRSMAVAQWYAAQTPEVLLRWRGLLEKVVKKDPGPIFLSPMIGFHGSFSRLILRTLRCWLSFWKDRTLRAGSRLASKFALDSSTPA